MGGMYPFVGIQILISFLSANVHGGHVSLCGDSNSYQLLPEARALNFEDCLVVRYNFGQAGRVTFVLRTDIHPRFV